MALHEYARYTDAAQLVQRAVRVIPGGVNSWTRWTDFPLNPARAKGARLWDVDGTEYLDFHGAYSAILLGHSYPSVTQAVTKQLDRLTIAGIGRTPEEVDLAERLVRHIACAEQVLLAPSGSDATYSAIRLARAVTGRSRVLKFAGCFHGPHDYVLRGPDADASDGVLEDAAKRVIVCDYNNLGAVRDAFAAHGDDIACVIVEPIAHNANLAPVPGFLDGLRDITQRAGTVLIFDEVITGFRTGLGGAQARYGVTPDLATFAKGMTNGFPGAAIAGPARLMSRFAVSATGSVPYSGTHNGNGVTVAAASATLTVLENRPVQEHLDALGARMREGLATITQEVGIPAVVTGDGAIYALHFMENKPVTASDMQRADTDLFVSYREEMCRRGVLEMPLPGMRAQVTYSHTRADVDQALDTSGRALRAALDRRARRH